jgi:type IV secretory pathway TraG/TraD family ATPase VirD4
MKNMAIQDIRNGEGICIVDPHGDFVEDVLQYIPKERADDVILFEPADMERPLGLNMLEVKGPEQKDFVIQEMIAIFYKLFPPEMIGPMFEHNMRNVMLTLMEDKQQVGTIAEIPRMFTDTDFQKYKLSKVKDPIVRAFWEKEMAKTSDFHKSEMLGYLISKVGRFVENEMMRNIIGQQKSSFDFREVMDKGKILLINLSKGKTGEVNAKLLGLIIVSKLQMAALSRADIPEEQRKDFYLYVDEFQNFVTDSFATILSEARKYRLNLIMAHQFISQLSEQKEGSSKVDTKMRDAVFGNTGTMISFRIGVEDSEIMAKEFAPVFNEFDVINMERFNAYIKLMVKGSASRPFDMETYPKPPGANLEMGQLVRNLSRLKFGRPRSEVQTEILDRSKLGVPATTGPVATERTL